MAEGTDAPETQVHIPAAVTPKIMVEFEGEPDGDPVLIELADVSMVLSRPPSPNGMGTGLVLRGGGMIIVRPSYRDILRILDAHKVQIFRAITIRASMDGIIDPPRIVQ